jgi:TonB family protein
MAAVASVAGGYVWEDPGDSIMIQVGLDLVERLGAAVQQGLGGGPRGTEIGGILLGRTLPGFGRAVLIEDFELAPCEHLRGGSYTLSAKDKRTLGTRLARHRASDVVGYFRSQTRPGMYLDQDDFAVFSQYFPEPWQVFLLVRPSTEGPAMGGFFFWEDGDVNRRSPYRQFPFDSARLGQGGFPIIAEEPVAVSAPVVIPAGRPIPVVVPQRETRARRRLPPLPWVVVPIIAVLFLIAGLFVSENQEPVHLAAVAKASPPVEPLLPEPVPQTAGSAPAVTPPVATNEPAPPVVTKPIATPKAKPANTPLQRMAVPAPVAAARTVAREIEPPPELGVASTEPRMAAVLPSRVSVAPPPEIEVSYEAPHPGVFRRALHKIEGSGATEPGAFVPPTPIHKVAPIKSARNGTEAGPVDVRVFIDEAGNVSRAQVLTKGSDLAAASLSAARQWQFTPARKHDKPVSSEMVLHFHF